MQMARRPDFEHPCQTGQLNYSVEPTLFPTMVYQMYVVTFLTFQTVEERIFVSGATTVCHRVARRGKTECQEKISKKKTPCIAEADCTGKNAKNNCQCFIRTKIVKPLTQRVVRGNLWVTSAVVSL